MKKIDDMTAQHQFVWTTLQALEDGERILGPQLQEHAAIDDMRLLYKIVKDLRCNSYLVGSSKSGARGYYEIRDEVDLERTTRELESAALDMLQTARLMRKAFYEKVYGDLLKDIEEEGGALND